MNGAGGKRKTIPRGLPEKQRGCVDACISQATTSQASRKPSEKGENQSRMKINTETARHSK
jgi:hypothetical protein